MSNPAPFNLEPPPNSEGDRAFLAAWKNAIWLAECPSYFGAHSKPDIDRAVTLRDLAPRTDQITKGINKHPASRAALLAILVGFYNPAEGGRLARKIDCNGFGALVAPLTPAAREAVAALLLHYRPF